MEDNLLWTMEKLMEERGLINCLCFGPNISNYLFFEFRKCFLLGRLTVTNATKLADKC